MVRAMRARSPRGHLVSFYDEDAEIGSKDELLQVSDSDDLEELAEALAGPDGTDVMVIDDDGLWVVIVDLGPGIAIAFPTTLREVRQIVEDLRADARGAAQQD